MTTVVCLNPKFILKNRNIFNGNVKSLIVEQKIQLILIITLILKLLKFCTKKNKNYFDFKKKLF